jgi:uncharacterized protein YfiM (DUF2279 family)
MRATPSARGKVPARAHARANGVPRPTSAEPKLDFSLLRLAVPERLALAIAATGLLWLAIAWALA